jgi:hypothetical protein
MKRSALAERRIAGKRIILSCLVETKVEVTSSKGQRQQAPQILQGCEMQRKVTYLRITHE